MVGLGQFLIAAYALHQAGDCWPDTCPVCADECASCGQWNHECACPDPKETP